MDGLHRPRVAADNASHLGNRQKRVRLLKLGLGQRRYSVSHSILDVSGQSVHTPTRLINGGRECLRPLDAGLAAYAHDVIHGLSDADFVHLADNVGNLRVQAVHSNGEVIDDFLMDLIQGPGLTDLVAALRILIDQRHAVFLSHARNLLEHIDNPVNGVRFVVIDAANRCVVTESLNHSQSGSEEPRSHPIRREPPLAVLCLTQKLLVGRQAGVPERTRASAVCLLHVAEQVGSRRRELIGGLAHVATKDVRQIPALAGQGLQLFVHECKLCSLPLIGLLDRPCRHVAGCIDLHPLGASNDCLRSLFVQFGVCGTEGQRRGSQGFSGLGGHSLLLGKVGQQRRIKLGRVHQDSVFSKFPDVVQGLAASRCEIADFCILTSEEPVHHRHLFTRRP